MKEIISKNFMNQLRFSLNFMYLLEISSKFKNLI